MEEDNKSVETNVSQSQGDTKDRGDGKTAGATVSVCVLTYMRPRELERLLVWLNALEFKKCEPSRLEVVVIDNDPAASACGVCEAMKDGSRWPLRYCVEARRGIACARNRAVQVAEASADFIAFIDDDETPEPAWLDELLDVQRRSQASVVAGPVLSRFEGEVPKWVLRGGFFERARHETGSELDYARTGNVLISSKVFWKRGLWFDEGFARTDCDDTHFFMRVHRNALSIVWADDAVVYEHVPKGRLSVVWLLRRSIRGGNWYGECEYDLRPSLRIKLARFAKGIGHIVVGLGLVVAAILGGMHIFVRGLADTAVGLGMVLSGIGIRLKAR